jgi:hypothetical protein
MKNKINLPGFIADLKYPAAKSSYIELLNIQTKKDSSVLMQRLRLPSNMAGLSVSVGLGFWCEAGCGIAYAACLAGCSAAGPFALPCAAACTGLYRACNDGC